MSHFGPKITGVKNKIGRKIYTHHLVKKYKQIHRGVVGANYDRLFRKFVQTRSRFVKILAVYGTVEFV